ncbi:MAG: UvrD-helicase domain-containing protein, partial [Clostridium sp.]
MILAANAEKKLKDIVMSIQKEQDEIIREERTKVVVVNGVAGSGKTTIALHRVAYLLYNFREQLTDKVLILGPNDIFMDYISDILPTLGESGIDQQTFIGFAYNEIGLKEHVIDFPNYLEDVLKGNKNVIDAIKYKSSKEFVQVLDKKIADYEENYFEFKPVMFMGEEVVSVEETEELFNKHYKYMPLFRRSQKVKLVITSKIKDKRDEKVREINAIVKAKLESLTPEELLIEENNIEFERKIQIRDIIRQVMNTKAEIEEWISSESIVSMYKEFMSIENLTYLDLPAILYLMIKLDGKKIRQDIRHIVIDEAQDYSYLQFVVLKELTGCKSFTIVGDSNQRLVKVEEIPAMLKLKEIFGGFVKEYNLNKSYRSTHQIMEYASNILHDKAVVPFVRKGKYDVIETTIPAEDKEGLTDVLLELLEEYEDEKYENIAIITTGKSQLQRIAPRLKA